MSSQENNIRCRVKHCVCVCCMGHWSVQADCVRRLWLTCCPEETCNIRLIVRKANSSLFIGHVSSRDCSRITGGIYHVNKEENWAKTVTIFRTLAFPYKICKNQFFARDSRAELRKKAYPPHLPPILEPIIVCFTKNNENKNNFKLNQHYIKTFSFATLPKSPAPPNKMFRLCHWPVPSDIEELIKSATILESII